MTTVVVQRGHVPRTSGATGAPGEQQFAIDTAAKLKPILVGMGLNVRVIDADESASQYRGDFFVAIHYDSSGSSSANGASVGYQNSAGARFARAWKAAYRAEGWTRAFREDNYSPNLAGYYGVRNAIAAGNSFAIITESGFHSNSDDDALMTPIRTARSIARAIAEMTGKDMDEMVSDADKSEIANLVVNRLLSKKLDDPQDKDTEPDATIGGIFRYDWSRSRTADDKLDRIITLLEGMQR